MRKFIVAAILAATVLLSACSSLFPDTETAKVTPSEVETTAAEEASTEEETTEITIMEIVSETEETTEENHPEETTEAPESDETETFRYFYTVTSGGVFGASGAIEQCLDLTLDERKEATAVIYQMSADEKRGNDTESYPYYDRTAADKIQELLYGPGLPEIVDTYCSASLGGERSYLTVLPDLEAVIIESAKGVYQVYAKEASADLEKLGSLLAKNIIQ